MALSHAGIGAYLVVKGEGVCRRPLDDGVVAQRGISRPFRIEYGGARDSILDNLSTPELIEKDVPGEDDDAVADFSFVSITTDNSKIFYHALLT